MVATILLEKSDPLSVRRNFQLVVDKFDTFLQAVSHFPDLAHYLYQKSSPGVNSLLPLSEWNIGTGSESLYTGAKK